MASILHEQAFVGCRDAVSKNGAISLCFADRLLKVATLLPCPYDQRNDELPSQAGPPETGGLG